MAATIKRFGAIDPRTYSTDADSVFAKGAMLYLDTTTTPDVVRPASEFTWDTDTATTQAAFANLFVGIALEPKAAGESKKISVDVSGDSVYEFDVASGVFETAQTFGPAKQASANLLEDNKVASAVAASSVARLHEQQPVASTRVCVQFASSQRLGSGNSNAEVG